jgi:probable HAF family extracellular repeat protein
MGQMQRLTQMTTYTYVTIDGSPNISNNTYRTTLTGINNLGQIIGSSSGTPNGFMYSNGQISALNLDSGAGNNIWIIGGNNDAGQIVDSSVSNAYGYYYGYLVTNGKNTPIGDPNGYYYTVPKDINNVGQIVGYYIVYDQYSYAFIDTNGTFTTITPQYTIPGLIDIYANGINDSGEVVGAYVIQSGPTEASQTVHAFVANSNSFVTIGDDLGTGAAALGVNNAGQIVGYYADSAGINHAFLDDAGVFTTIDDPLGTKGSVATGINDSGQIIGYYTDSNGQQHGFLATPSTSLTKTSKAFEDAGGKDALLAKLANAAYDLAPDEPTKVQNPLLPEDLVTANDTSPTGHTDYMNLGQSLQWLNANDLPVTPSGSSTLDPFITGFRGGVYTNGPASPLVGRTDDALFISFRGTNDDPSGKPDLAAIADGLSPTFDEGYWFKNPILDSEGMTDYYNLYKPLLDELKSYITDSANSANPIVHIYVTGHSLGAAMAEHYMEDTEYVGSTDNRFEAVTFSNTGFEGTQNANDSRITNVLVQGDPAAETQLSAYVGIHYGVVGDTYLVQNLDTTSPDPFSTTPTLDPSLHSMELYESVVKLISGLAAVPPFSGGNPIPATELSSNGVQDTVTLPINISYDILGWHTSLQSGILQGTSGDDLLIAGPGLDALGGSSGADRLYGNAGDDVLVGNSGNDAIDGGTGINTAVYSGRSTDYRRSQATDGSWTITDLRKDSPDGTDSLTHVQFLQFSDGKIVTLPAVPSIVSISPDSGIGGDNITNASVVTLSGTADPSSTVKIYEGSNLITFGLADQSGNWAITLPSLSDGSHTLMASGIDTSGNVSQPSTLTLVIDTIAPVVPTLTLHSDTGKSSTDRITNIGQVDVGALEPGGTWQYSTNNGVNWTPGTGTSLTLVGDGVKTLLVQQADVAGNLSSKATLTFTLDTAAPVPVINSAILNNGTKKATLTGTTSAASDSVSSYDGTAPLGNASVASTAKWSFTTSKLPNS